MSNNLDDSIGSEIIADDEKSLYERINSNSINNYKIKMKTDLNDKRDQKIKKIHELPAYSQRKDYILCREDINSAYNMNIDRDSFTNSLSGKATCDQSSNNRYFNNNFNNNIVYNASNHNNIKKNIGNERILTNNSVGKILHNTSKIINNSINYSNTLNPAEMQEKKKLTGLILEKEDEINFCSKKYDLLKTNFNDKKKNYLAKIDVYNKIKSSNIELKKLINFHIKEKNKK